MTNQNKQIKKPHWLKRNLPKGGTYENVREILKKKGLHTVCREAKCPNMWECFSDNTATFLIMGSKCTRTCRFCAVPHGTGLKPPDLNEPKKVAEASKKMNLKYVVITSVTRDDLKDGGASFFAETVRELKKSIPGVKTEVLIPDFQGDKNALLTVMKSEPNVLNHNIETVPGLYSEVRPEAIYKRSLELLSRVGGINPSIPAKSGIMLGLGEKKEEVYKTFDDLLNAGCTLLTLGQYLQPSKDHIPVQRYVPPEEFEEFRQIALYKGFKDVAGGPFVRSSYQAHKLYQSKPIT